MTLSLVLLVCISSLSMRGGVAFNHQPLPQRSRLLSSASDRRSRSDLPPCHSGALSPVKMATDAEGNEGSGKVRYLGSGDNAIIRPGVVLVAPTHEYDHFLMKSAVYIYAIGLDENENMIIRGVVLDHPTAFMIGEMSPNVMGSLADNRLFRGGYDGSDTAMMLHSAGGPDGPIKSDAMIGASEIFEGGIVSAMESVDAGLIKAEQCKFFFNFMQFTQMELDNMFAGSEDGDEWVSLEVPPEYVLNSDYSRGGLWYKLRNNIRVIRKNL